MKSKASQKPKSKLELSPAKPQRAPVRFSNARARHYQQMPEQFTEAQNSIEEQIAEQRQERAVYADSIESCVGYDSLIRILGKHYTSQVAYYRSIEGGGLSLEEARKKAYHRNNLDKEGAQLLDLLLSIPKDQIDFSSLLELHSHSPSAAQNLWEMIKREAAHEFESGHLAAAAFEPAEHLRDAWNRAAFLGMRESFCAEYQPRGGIELSQIDVLTQAFLQLQYWMERSVKRACTTPTRLPREYLKLKEWQQQANPRGWEIEKGEWDVPTITEQEALDAAHQAVDRWQRMYYRALRNLRDWRRYTPQVTINNPKQVNIGEQINVANDDAKQICKG